MEVLALIPARGGSLRVPNKNILPLNGKPLITYTISAARAAHQVTRTLVSTDSKEIAAVARSAGAQVPFLRPSGIAQSASTEMEFLIHALDWLKTQEGYVPDLLVILYPTSPFRTAASIDAAVDRMKASPEADSLRSVRLCSEHPYKMWVMQEGLLKPLMGHADRNAHTWSYQCLPQVYIQNASIYITRPRTILEKGNPVGDIILPFVMSEEESLDVNTALDFETAVFLMGKR